MVLNSLGYKFVRLQGEVKGKMKGLTKTLSWIKRERNHKEKYEKGGRRIGGLESQ